MEISIVQKLKSNPKYYELLKENSQWIKFFNRGMGNYKDYETFIKEKYKLRVTDKISSTVDDVDLVLNIINTIK